MRDYGLIGFPLSHSFSEGYFTDRFTREGITDCRYTLYPLEQIERVGELIRTHPTLLGLNVTIPHKEKVIPFLDEIDGEAEAIGAVNTIKIFRQGNEFRLKGYNTDAYGFRKSVTGYVRAGDRALILGTGGASKAVAYVLKSLGVGFTYVSRTGRDEERISYEQLTPAGLAGIRLIVNTSPLGMHPDTGSCPPIPYNALKKGQILYDLIYNPPETIFLAEGRKRGTSTINGLQMLFLQADKAWEIWNSPD